MTVEANERSASSRTGWAILCVFAVYIALFYVYMFALGYSLAALVVSGHASISPVEAYVTYYLPGALAGYSAIVVTRSVFRRADRDKVFGVFVIGLLLLAGVSQLGGKLTALEIWGPYVLAIVGARIGLATVDR